MYSISISSALLLVSMKNNCSIRLKITPLTHKRKKNNKTYIVSALSTLSNTSLSIPYASQEVICVFSFSLNPEFSWFCLISNFFYITLSLTSSCPFIFLFGVLIHFYFLSIAFSFQLLSKQLNQIYSSFQTFMLLPTPVMERPNINDCSVNEWWQWSHEMLLASYFSDPINPFFSESQYAWGTIYPSLFSLIPESSTCQKIRVFHMFSLHLAVACWSRGQQKQQMQLVNSLMFCRLAKLRATAEWQRELKRAINSH